MGDETNDVAIADFAKALVILVRDQTIRGCDLLLRPNARGLSASHWKEQLAQARSGRDALAQLIPEIVDKTIFHLLAAIDNGKLALVLKVGGSMVDLREAGRSEMAGWFIGSGGWREEFSKERFHDAFWHIRLKLDDV